MGNYFGKKNKENPNLRDNQHEQDLPHNLQKRKFEKPTIYRPQIFIDYYKSQLLKVNNQSKYIASLVDDLYDSDKNYRYFQDGDGSLANEFWEQLSNGKMRRVRKGVSSVGYEEYRPPRLSHNFHYVLVDNKSLVSVLERKYNFIDAYPGDEYAQ